MCVRMPGSPQYPDFWQNGQSMIAFCGLFFSSGDSDRGGGEKTSSPWAELADWLDLCRRL